MNTNKLLHIPFFPQSTHIHYSDEVSVWWFEPRFSQSSFGQNVPANGSHACTLIALLAASHIAEKHIHVSIIGFFNCFRN